MQLRTGGELWQPWDLTVRAGVTLKGLDAFANPIYTAQPLLPDRARNRGLSRLVFKVGPRGRARSGR
ncbi:MAG TPA: hypothetical protein VIR01_15435, partial [Pyrinomonadaceae bacterium]